MTKTTGRLCWNAKPTAENLRRLVRKLGGNIEVYGRKGCDGWVEAEAPPGHVWQSTATHCVVAEFIADHGEEPSSAIKRIITDIILGTMECPDIESEYCEWCTDTIGDEETS